MAVGVEDGVDAADVFADGLGVEVGAGVDEDGAVVVGEADGGAGAAVARVAFGGDGGAADGTVAAERGDAHGGAGAEEGEGGLHGVVEAVSHWKIRTGSIIRANAQVLATPLTLRSG